jgi:hypothetical protein
VLAQCSHRISLIDAELKRPNGVRAQKQRVARSRLAAEAHDTDRQAVTLLTHTHDVSAAYQDILEQPKFVPHHYSSQNSRQPRQELEWLMSDAIRGRNLPLGLELLLRLSGRVEG